MLGKPELVDLNLRESHIQFSESKPLLIYSKGASVIFHNYETNSCFLRIEAELKVRFSRFYEQGNLENTLVYLQDDTQVVYHNIITNKRTKLKLKIDGVFSVDFDIQNDILFVLDSQKEHMQIFDIFQKTQVVQKKTVLSSAAGFHVVGFKHIKGDLVAAYGVQTLVIIDLKEGKAISQNIETNYPISCLSFDQNGNKIAIGTHKGKILICQNYLSKKVQISSYHWHSMGVGALQFMDSRTLLSGGEEAVLVFWFEGSNRKDFCPRLYGSINGIFLDNYGEKIAIKYSNNKISVHNSANYKLICLINEIDTSFAVNASISNHKGCSIVYGENNNIEFLGQKKGELLLQSKNVTSRNNQNVGKVEDKLLVSAASLSLRHDWLAISEYCKISSEFEVSRIKFFKFNQAKFEIQLVTVETDPHASKIIAISSLEINDHECCFFSLGLDGSLVQWIRTYKDKEEGEIWIKLQTYDFGSGVAFIPKIVCHFDEEERTTKVVSAGENSLTVLTLGYTLEKHVTTNVSKVYFSQTNELQITDLISTSKNLIVQTSSAIFVLSLEDFSILKTIHLGQISCSTRVDDHHIAATVCSGEKTALVILNLEEKKIKGVHHLPSLASKIWFNNVGKSQLYVLLESNDLYRVPVSHVKTLNEEHLTDETFQEHSNLNSNRFKSSLQLTDLNTFLESARSQNTRASGNFDLNFEKSHLIPNLGNVLDFSLNKKLLSI